MKILVTGAAGFIGSHLFDYLLKEGHDVVGLDNYSIGDYQHEKIFKIDLLDKNSVDNFIETERPEIVYHLAAWAHEGLSQFSPIKITENNYGAYLNLLVPVIKYKAKRIVVTSSMSVYGDQEPPFSEEMDLYPVDIYGLAKSAIERSTEILTDVHGLEYNIVRPHNVYGPRQSLGDPYRNVVAIFINNAMRGVPLFIYGDGLQTRAFTFIDDIVAPIAKAGFIEQTKEVINVGPEEEFNILSLARAVQEHFPEAKIQHVPDRPVEVKNAYCTNKLARELLGYETTTDFRSGIAKMVEWAKFHGPVAPKYLDALELEEGAPETWTKKLI